MISALAIVFIMVFIISFSYISGHFQKPTVDGRKLISPDNNVSLKITGKDGSTNNFSAEVALTPEEQARGLMNRSSLPADAGMLFDFRCTEVRRFWMENTLIPLDMIFIDQNGKIIDIHENATPLSRNTITSSGPCRYVLEINGGICRGANICIGDQMTVQK